MLVAKSECHAPFQGSWTLGYHFLDSSKSWCAGRLEDYSLPTKVFLPDQGVNGCFICIKSETWAAPSGDSGHMHLNRDRATHNRHTCPTVT